ncbi:tumor necrosis factor receptor superfamily member 1A [Myripristis murdjan]|uniref:Tumor necrosis factor receptor superfamily, member 1a n=1 Tax=Myripristis murdjan TaxID=586833 RepID=A0A667X0I1_9TELE|nr:tumor necrosis factor receptor superfamily member 1A-like [Myripristis murdjan]
MEGVGLWNKKPHGGSVCTLLILLLFPTLGLTKPQPLEEECPVGDFRSDDGICCNKCAQGFRYVADCQAEGQRTSCKPCEEGETFMDQMNYTPNCKICKRCKKYEVMVSPCSKERNTVCRCKTGFYKEVIGPGTDQCIKCHSCGLREIQTYACTPENNTVCECEKGYYRHKTQCLPCKDCTTDCKLHCPTTDVIKKPAENEHESLKLVLVGVGVVGLVLVVVVGFVTYKTTKQHTKRRLLSSSPTSDVFPDTSQNMLCIEKPSDNYNNAVPYSPVSDQEPSSLPDCIPLEIKFSELIYTVLDLVPVPQVKQLVRSLGVTDTEIERAEADHRACKEAHYQMLRMWAERGSQSRGGSSGVMLHRPLLQELLDKLSSMQLGWAVEELQTKYGIQ